MYRFGTFPNLDDVCDSSEECFEKASEPLYGFRTRVTVGTPGSDNNTSQEIYEEIYEEIQEKIYEEIYEEIRRQTGEEFESEGRPECRTINVCN